MENKKNINESAKKMYENTKIEVEKRGKNFSEYKTLYDIPKTMLSSELTEFNKDNRWLLKFPKKYGIEPYYIESVTKPSFPYVFGDSISICLRETIKPNLKKILLKLYKKSLTKPFKLKLEILTPDGEVSSMFKINQCGITNIGFSNLSYLSNNVSKIYLTINYKSVKLK